MTRQNMKESWDAWAAANARHAIAPANATSEEDFRESGRRDVERLMEGLAARCNGSERVLEVGCGTGRLLEHLAGRFPELVGVDVSGEMVRQGRERLAHLTNIRFEEVDGRGTLPFPDESFDFVFSLYCFIHIPDKYVIRRYLEETRRVLRPGGIFRFYLFGRRAGLLATAREWLTKKNAWRGVKFRQEEILDTTRAAGFAIVESRYLAPPPGTREPFFGKTVPHIIWVTAERPRKS